MLENVTKTYAWQEAMELSRELTRLCEEFSDGDRNVLVGHLRQAVVEIPATVAVDITLGRPATLEPAIRLATELELVHRIYPAIETGTAPQKLEDLLRRMRSNNFTEQEPASVDEAEEEQPAPEPNEASPAAPTSIPVTPQQED
ncbi:hypothetical protein EPO04_00545 [Patescibacteria group bacterium]|nr:MAG: hypothetical protein EPO04_00545 [Patescibacteria group bacterium]